MKKTFYELWFAEKGKQNRDVIWAKSIGDAKKQGRKLFKKGATGIIIDSYKMEEGNDCRVGDIDDNSRKHYSLQDDGKTFKPF